MRCVRGGDIVRRERSMRGRCSNFKQIGSVVVEGKWKHQEDKIVGGGWIVETAVIQNYF